MKRNIRNSVLCLILTLSSVVCANTIKYKNANNSILMLKVGSTNKLTGKFTTAVPIAKCKDVIGIPTTLSGILDGSNISFSVKYPSCESVVSFDGHIDEDFNNITVDATQKFLFPNADIKETVTHEVFTKVEPRV
jgi:Avidin family